MKSKYTLLKDKPKAFFQLIPQTGVTHKFCLDDPAHNAIWDMAVSPEGRIFFSVCGENFLPLYARLYEYDRKNKCFIKHMELEKEILKPEHSVRTSKFHTAISFMGGNKILSATHTTSPAPGHPTWMPWQYADHPFEGYAGSDLLIYDYETHECKSLGIITPHDTVYGATYDPKNGDYFAITCLRGVGYVYNVHSKELRCLGQISDTSTSRTFLCSDGHIYGSTFSGAMFRYNTDIRDIEWLGVSATGLIRHAREIDGKLYFTTGPCAIAGRGQELYAYDFKENKITTIGRPVPKADAYEEDAAVYYNAYGMAFDSQNRMWYSCMTFCGIHKYMGARLYMWDFLHGKEPVDCGFLGSPARTLSVCAEMHIVDDVLYVSDGNHTSDDDKLCGIIEIELDKFVPALETEERIMSHDYINYIPYQYEAREFYPKDDFEECFARYDKYFQESILYFKDFNRANAYSQFFNHTCGVSVWEKLGREYSHVVKIQWNSNTAFSAYVGKSGDIKLDCIVDDKGNASVVGITTCEPVAAAEIKVSVPNVDLPAVAGRRYLANPEASLRLQDGSILVGTQDTMLAVIKDNTVFSLGGVCSAGGVHSMDITPDGTVYGVAGHSLAMGQLFKYTAENGVEQLGIVPEAKADNGRIVALRRPKTLAISPDGKYLAIGGEDEIGGIAVLSL